MNRPTLVSPKDILKIPRISLHPDTQTDLRYVWSYELTIQGSNSWMPDDLVQLMDYIQTGRLDPVIDTVLPLDQTAEGVRLLRDREVIGKIIIEP